VGDLDGGLEFLVKPPCLVFEDEHLLVVNKPAGLNTHSPSPFAGQGLYEWLRDHEPRWASLAVIHRLDKETSGIILFSKTPLANRSLTGQFANRAVLKKYLLLTDRAVAEKDAVVKTALVRLGDKYVSRPIAAGAEIAETSFAFVKHADMHGFTLCALVEAVPLTGRTHQIRVHAADKGFPILGDTRYGGSPASRLCLHAAEITFRHPASGQEICFQAPVDFHAESSSALRRALINSLSTTAYRLIHGASDSWPGWYVDRLGDYLLSQSAEPITKEQQARLALLFEELSVHGAYHKRLSPRPQSAPSTDVWPKQVLGSSTTGRFTIQENGLQFEVSFADGYSVGLFLDQRDNRRRLLTGHIAPGFSMLEPQSKHLKPEILNTFAYTCGFSVYAAKAGWRTTSLDLSKKYLEWGKRNFLLNQIDPVEHDFIFGDVFDWLRRLQKKQRGFDVILLDPPTFSQSKEFGPFRAEKDYGKLVAAALPLLKPRGVLFASCNTAGWPPESFLAAIKKPIQVAKRTLLQEHYFPQPPDYPVSRAEPAYLKTVWLRLQ
jgi:23S rRNA (cytosine1962-C5)-methyltransferase